MLFGEMVGSITTWSREAGEESITRDSLNDAIEKLSDALLTIRLGDGIGAPVTLSLAQGTERTTLITVPDPTVAPTMSSINGAIPNMPARTATFAFTLVTPSGSETKPSPMNTLSIPASSAFYCNAPSESEVPTQPQIIGWCLYMQLVTSTGYANWQRMNAQPIPMTQNFQEPILQPGDTFPEIPLPTSNTTGDTIFYIDHLEIQRPDMTWKAWEQGDIDGTALRRAAGIVGAASVYQNYAFDVVNNSTLEIRPATTIPLNPRYFYVARPGRIVFDQAQIPFQNVSSTIPFLRYEGLALLFMTLNEPEQAQMWQSKADATLAQIKTTQTRTRARAELRVQHYRGMM